MVASISASALLVGGTVLGGAYLNSQAAGDAADTQAGAARDASQAQVQAARISADEQQKIFDKQVALQEPWREAGTYALGQLKTATAPGGMATTPYTLSDFETGPNSGLYKFANAQAQEAMRNQMGAGGQGLSTNAVVGAGTLAGNLADQFYTQGFNQDMAQKQFQLGALQSLTGEGQQATNQTSAAAGQLGQNLGNLAVGSGNATASGIMGAANANAAGTVGQANAVSGAANQLSSMYMMNQLFGGGGGGAATTLAGPTLTA